VTLRKTLDGEKLKLKIWNFSLNQDSNLIDWISPKIKTYVLQA
jgi:hypothetical protein